MLGQLLILELEWPGHQGALSRTLGEQIVQTEETLHGNQEKGCEEEKETLTVLRDETSQRPKGFFKKSNGTEFGGFGFRPGSQSLG